MEFDKGKLTVDGKETYYARTNYGEVQRIGVEGEGGRMNEPIYVRAYDEIGAAIYSPCGLCGEATGYRCTACGIFVCPLASCRGVHKDAELLSELSAGDEELEAALRTQALEDPILRNLLSLLRDYPRDGATACRVMRTGLLALSRHAAIMRKTAERIIELTPLPVSLSTIVDKATKEVEEG